MTMLDEVWTPFLAFHDLVPYEYTPYQSQYITRTSESSCYSLIKEFTPLPKLTIFPLNLPPSPPTFFTSYSYTSTTPSSWISFPVSLPSSVVEAATRSPTPALVALLARRTTWTRVSYSSIFITRSSDQPKRLCVNKPNI